MHSIALSSMAAFALAASALGGLENPCPCVADLNFNGVVDGADLGLLLAAWGGPDGDLNGDGVTDGADLGLLLAAWGPCAPPVNDSCFDATTIPPSHGALTIPFCTTSATFEPLPISNCGSAFEIYNDIWYEFEAKSDGELTLSTCGAADFDTVIAVYEAIFPEIPLCPTTGGKISFANLIGCNDDQTLCPDNTSQLEVELTKGYVYKIRLGGFSPGADGIGTLTVNFDGEGDSCFNPVSAGSANPYSYDGCTLDNPLAETPPCGFGDAYSEWIVWTAPCNGFVTMSTCHPETDFDTVIAVWRETFDGGCTGNFVECEDDSSGAACDLPGVGSKTSLEFFADQGIQYWIQVTGYNGASGNFRLTIDQDCI